MSVQPSLFDADASSQYHVNILLITGPVFLGAVFAWMLYGTLTAQYYFYKVSFRGDSKLIRYSIYALLFVETCQTVFVTNFAWSILCAGWGNQAAILIPNWSTATIPIVSGFVAAWVQIFYAWRIYVLGRWRVVSLGIVALALAQGACGIVIGFRFATLGTWLYVDTVQPLVIAWLVGSALCDIVIATAMTWFLTRARDKINGEATHKMLARLTRMAIETGTATAAIALLDLALELAFEGSNAHLLPCMMISKMYSNSLMLSFNARAPAFSGRAEVQISGSSTWRRETSGGNNSSRRAVQSFGPTTTQESMMEAGTFSVKNLEAQNSSASQVMSDAHTHVGYRTEKE